MEIDDKVSEENNADVVSATPTSARKKRKGRAKTPIVDDTMRKISRFMRNVEQAFINLIENQEGSPVLKIR